MKISKLSILGVALLFLWCVPVAAHEMFLKPKKYLVDPGAVIQIELVNGTFDQSENVITRDRMVDVTVHGGGATEHPFPSQWRDRMLAAVLSHQVKGEGTYVVGVSTRPRTFEQTVEQFTDYLKHEGIADTLKDFKALAKKPSMVMERYSKHVKTLIQVGKQRTDDYQKVLGYPVEIILDQNPYDVVPGEPLSFKVVRKGAPVANQLVYASFSGYHHHGEDGGHERAITMRTDEEGRAQFTPDRAGIWYTTLIYMEKLTDDPNADYESNWTTLTFEIE